MTKNLLLLVAALGGGGSVACQSGGIGDPCIPEFEYDPKFAGFSASEVNVESRSFQCKSRVCLVANFQGRVSCPYGQPDGYENLEPGKRCYIPGSPAQPDPPGSVGATCTNCVNSTVPSQLVDRPADQGVYCSCRCDGPDSNVRYCDCPSGFSCKSLVSSYGIQGGGGQLVGSYCIKEGSDVADVSALQAKEQCKQAGEPACGPAHPSGL